MKDLYSSGGNFEPALHQSLTELGKSVIESKEVILEEVDGP